jgi:hypothetical protein
MARRRGKLARDPPEVVAERALANLLKEIPNMKANYAQAMDEFAMDPSRQATYKLGVALWTSAMRDPEVRRMISEAVARAKQKLFTTSASSYAKSVAQKILAS